MFVATPLRANILIIDSDKHEESFALAQLIGRHSTRCGTVQYMDMHRDPEIAQSVIRDLRAREDAGTLDLVIAMGPMASRLIPAELSTSPVFALTAEQPRHSAHTDDRVQALVTSPPVRTQLTAFKALVPGMRRVGILARHATIEPIYEELAKATAELGIGLNIFYVDHREEVGAGLRLAIGQTDGLFFLRDSVVINSDTIRFILRLTLENRVPTFTYSPDLVRMGMGAALQLNPNKLAEALGTAACARLQNKTPNTLPPPPFMISVNPVALGVSADSLQSDILGMKVIAR